VLGGLARRLHAAGAPPATIPEVAARTAGWRPALAAEPGALAELDPGRAARWLRLRALAEALAVERAGPARGADAAWAARLRRLAAALAP
jgi:hypothetical protein